MYAIVYLPTGERVKCTQFDLPLALKSYNEANRWITQYVGYLSTDTIDFISKSYYLEIVEVDNV